ncbi:MAG: acyl-CoA dehydrogenase C-terminal domain-containing protein [Pseudomonadales bacterium]|jgi:alkylation response protein AidB-like acyl-CoA dehydrogenase|nr:acyl-CoA dehydrogenase C-terminal domain-containing protein [Pseudomonadales bacterium]
MPAYRTPYRDIRFLLHDVYAFPAHYAGLAGGEPVSAELLDGILDEIGRFTEQELAPLNAVGDRIGCRLENGVVTTPPGFREAYASFVAGGWTSVTGDPHWGGQGLPPSIGTLVEELATTTNMAWSMYPALSHGAVNALEAHGTDAQKEVYLRPLLAGSWTGTMCLTEPHCGSDVGLVRTRAEARADGSYAISGTKIFISAGEHDLSENIVHLVLARLPDAPAGTRGISMFIVPKYLPDAQGAPGARNGVSCLAIEEKMGIHGNATCMLAFDDATGFLVGPENGGMRCMFTMMNAARLVVGIQGLGQSEAAYQASLAYALDREQMRALSGPQAPARPADPIIVHPDVRRMLLTQKALAEGGRALVYFAALQADLAQRAADPEARAEAGRCLDLLTPVVKGFLTEVAQETTSLALQIFGGHGYIREHGVEQFMRDVRIAAIYEGTTQIQALDLLGRKVLGDGGKALLALGAGMEEECARIAALPELAAEVAALRPLLQEWGELAVSIGGRAAQDPDEIGAASVDFLMYSGWILTAWCWLRMLAACATLDPDDPFVIGKRRSGAFFFRRLLPRTRALAATLRDGAETLTALPAESFHH